MHYLTNTPLLKPNFCHHEVFSTITPEKPSNFGQALKGPDQVNWIKGAFAQYDNNRYLFLLTAPFPHANLTSTTRVLRSVSSPAIKNISDNIYPYFLRHCDNGGPQVKGFDFYQSSSLVLTLPTLRLVVNISATYHITICIVDITNAFYNDLKASSER